MIKLFLSVISIFFSILMIYLTQINFKKKLIGILGYFFWQILWIGIIIISIRPKYIDRFIEEQLDTNLFYIITVLSPQKRLIGIFKKMGFRSLEMNYKIVFLTNYFSFFNKSLFQIEKNFMKIKKKLSKKDLKIYKDHSDASFIKFLVINMGNCITDHININIKYV